MLNSIAKFAAILDIGKSVRLNDKPRNVVKFETQLQKRTFSGENIKAIVCQCNPLNSLQAGYFTHSFVVHGFLLNFFENCISVFQLMSNSLLSDQVGRLNVLSDLIWVKIARKIISKW